MDIMGGENENPSPRAGPKNGPPLPSSRPVMQGAATHHQDRPALAYSENGQWHSDPHSQAIHGHGRWHNSNGRASHDDGQWRHSNTQSPAVWHREDTRVAADHDGRWYNSNIRTPVQAQPLQPLQQAPMRHALPSQAPHQSYASYHDMPQSHDAHYQTHHQVHPHQTPQAQYGWHADHDSDAHRYRMPSREYGDHPHYAVYHASHEDPSVMQPTLMHPDHHHSQSMHRYSPHNYHVMDSNYAPSRVASVGPHQSGDRDAYGALDQTHHAEVYHGDDRNGRSFSHEDDRNDQDGMEVAKGSRAAAHNDKELRQLLIQNQNRTLQDVARDLRDEELGVHSERSRQMFAMIWLKKECTRGNKSTPRGTIYSSYEAMCQMERVTVLNPASFGKLVRLVFPGLKTRRLGVRGESKYHYVDLMFKKESPPNRLSDAPTPARQMLDDAPQPPSFILPATAIQQPASTEAPDTTAAPEDPEMPPAGLTSRARRAKARSTHSVYHSQDVSSLDELNTAPKTAVGLYFATEAEIQSQSAGALILPSIAPFLPDGTPVEVVEDLTALYHSHCSSLIECIRFCKEKNFFHLYTSLPGSMTDPVASLFGHPKIAAWIEECDLVVFRRAVAILSKLTLQIWPKSASTFLDSAANNLVSHICRSLDGLPQHAIEAKVEPAALFCGIIGRMMRVNSAAHSAALNLASDGNRKEMYVEWMKHIRINKIVEVVPSRGTRDVAKLLVDKLRSLLHLEATRLDEEKGTVYGDVVVGHSRATSDNNGAQDGDSESESHCLNALELWVAFVEDLPAHFPYATHAEIVWCAERVSTAVLRELTYASAKSFDAWYATKVFVDELIWLYGERGGFLMFSTSGDADPLSGVSSEATSCNSTQPLAQSSAMGEAPHAISAVGSSTPASKATGSTPAAVVMASTTQSAPMPVSACQADDVRHGGSTSTDQTNDGIYDASTPHSMAGAASVAGEAATHDDSGIGLELEFKVDHTDSPGANADSGPVCGH